MDLKTALLSNWILNEELLQVSLNNEFVYFIFNTYNINQLKHILIDTDRESVGQFKVVAFLLLISYV